VIDSSLFKSVLGHFASGVTVITARDQQGKDHGLTVSSFCSLSLVPPLVLACIEHHADTHAILEHAPRFAVNILAAQQEPIARRFSEQEQERFAGLGYSRGITGCALLEGALAYVECEIRHRYPGGDHTIVVGEVLSASTALEQPLLYYRGGYAWLER